MNKAKWDRPETETERNKRIAALQLRYVGRKVQKIVLEEMGIDLSQQRLNTIKHVYLERFGEEEIRKYL